MSKITEQLKVLADSLEELDEFKTKNTKPDPKSKEGVALEIAEVKKMKSIFSKDFSKITDSIEDIRESFMDGDSSLLENIESLQEELDERFEQIEDIHEAIKESLLKVENGQTIDAEMHKLGLTNMGRELVSTTEKLESGFNTRYEEIKNIINSHKEEGILSFIERDNILDKKFLQTKKDLEKFASGIYQYGSSFGVSVNGTLVGTTSTINYKAGTNVTITQSTDAQGIITLTFNASGGGAGTNFETPTGTINGTNKTFTVLNTPKYVVSDGVTYFLGNGYTLVGLTITMDIAPVGFSMSAY